MSRRFERRGDVSELKLAWKRQKAAEAEAWPYDRCEDCGEKYGACRCNGTTEEELNE